MKKQNVLKRKLKNGESCIGTWAVVPSSSTANIMAAAGLDFVIIDMEHGPMGFEMAEDMVRALENEGCTPLVRVPSNDAPTINRALEIGAHGIVVPQIETPEQARAAVNAAKYAPIGARGVSAYTRSCGYDARGDKGRTERTNNETMVVLLVEGKEGIANLENIAQIDNIDVLYVGTYDLTQSLGITDAVDAPEVHSAVAQCTAIIKKHGKSAGVLAQTKEDLVRWKDLGIQFIPYMVDCGIIKEACVGIVEKFNTVRNGG